MLENTDIFIRFGTIKLKVIISPNEKHWRQAWEFIAGQARNVKPLVDLMLKLTKKVDEKRSSPD